MTVDADCRVGIVLDTRHDGYFQDSVDLVAGEIIV
jgi:hypothetical protein